MDDMGLERYLQELEKKGKSFTKDDKCNIVHLKIRYFMSDRS